MSRVHSGGAIEALCSIVAEYTSPITARAVVRTAVRRSGRSERNFTTIQIDDRFVSILQQGLALYRLTPQQSADLKEKVSLLRRGRPTPIGTPKLSRPSGNTIPVADEHDIVRARGQARQLAQRVGFGHTDQIKIATAVSEITRNIYKYAGGGIITLSATGDRAGICIEARDEGPGIPHLDEVLSGNYVSKTGMGLGIWGCRKLMDDFEIQSKPGEGTSIKMCKYV